MKNSTTFSGKPVPSASRWKNSKSFTDSICQTPQALCPTFKNNHHEQEYIERPTPPSIFLQRLERKRRTTLLLFHHPLRYHDPALHLDGFHQNALCGRGIGTSAARHGNRQQQLPTDYGERLVRERRLLVFHCLHGRAVFRFLHGLCGQHFFQDIKIPEGLHHRPDIPGFKCREVYGEMVQNLHHILPYLLFSHRIGRLHPYRFHPFPLS